MNVTGAGLDNAGIYVNLADNCKFENNILHDDALGILIKSSNGAVISNNIATKNLLAGLGRAITLEQSHYATVSGNTISNQNYGIYLSGSVSNAISGNTITQSASDSIRLENSASNNVVFNNTASSSGSHGIYLSYSGDNNLSSNSVSNSYGNGIYLYWSPRTKVLDNEVDLGGSHDIMLDNSSDNTLTGNTISSSPYGIAVRYSNNNILTGNNAYNNSQGLYITLTSSNNTLSGNKANSNNGPGISLYRVSGNVVENNEAKSNTNSGIVLDNSSNNRVSNNNASGNSRGIYITSSAGGNTVSGNTFNSNTGDGIRVESAGNDNNLSSNNASSNGNYGIYLITSNSTSLLNNVASSNSKGIYLLSSSGNTISNNTVFNNNMDVENSNGIMLSLSSNNKVLRNTAYKNPYGISLNSSQNNNLSSNRVYLNSKAGMFLCARSTNNLIFNNYFNNSQNTDNNNTGCTWNFAKTQGRNIVNGPYIGGNYWADPYQYNDHSQVYANNDTDGDGIIDTTYSNDDVIDYLPLKEFVVLLPSADFATNVSSGYVPLTVQFTDLSQNAVSWSWDFGDGGSSSDRNTTHTYSAAGDYTVTLTARNDNGTATKTTVINAMNVVNVLPVADFSMSPTGGYAPLSVTFTDLSQNATSISWDVNCDGIEDSSASSFTYVYAYEGTYTAKLTANNANGTTSKTVNIIVDRRSSGGSSGGGGGGGGSPEPAKNVQVKELCQAFIANGKPIQFDFTKNATCVVSVGFDAKKTVGKTTTIVEQLKNKSTLVSTLSGGEVYKYFNVWVGNSGFASSSNIDNPTICFKVEKSWLQDKKVDKNSITLNRYSDKKWEQIPVSLSKEDSKYQYFTADVPGYSFFAITGKANVSPEETVTEIEPDDKPDNPESTAEDTGSEAGTESDAGDNKSMPGFEMVCGIIGLSAASLYRRK